MGALQGVVSVVTQQQCCPTPADVEGILEAVAPLVDLSFYLLGPFPSPTRTLTAPGSPVIWSELYLFSRVQHALQEIQQHFPEHSWG